MPLRSERFASRLARDWCERLGSVDVRGLVGLARSEPAGAWPHGWLCQPFSAQLGPTSGVWAHLPTLHLRGEDVSAGQERFTRRVQGVALAAAMPQGFLLDALAALL